MCMHWFLATKSSFIVDVVYQCGRSLWNISWPLYADNIR